MTLSYVRVDPIVDISSYALVRTACQILKKTLLFRHYIKLLFNEPNHYIPMFRL